MQATIGAVVMTAGLFAQTAPSQQTKAPTGYTDTPSIPGSKWRVHDDQEHSVRQRLPASRPRMRWCYSTARVSPLGGRKRENRRSG
jgi:hypothetical protein